VNVNSRHRFDCKTDGKMEEKAQIVALIVLTVVSVCVLGQSTSSTTTGSSTGGSTSTTRAPSTTTPSIEEVCGNLTDCDNCVKDAKCFWCDSISDGVKCIKYPTGQIIPHKSICPLAKAKWGTCKVNFEALLITMGVLGGVLIISTCCCVYCCCCRRKNNSSKWAREDERMDREREARRERHDERRADRKLKMDEIRRKYGLVKDDNPYQRFEDA